MSTKRSEEQEILRAAFGPGPECLSIEELEQVLTGGISASTAVGKHVRSCSYCQTEMQMLQRFGPAGEGQAGPEVQQIVSQLQANPQRIFPKPAQTSRSVPWWERAFTMRRFAQASLGMAAVLLVTAAVLRLHTGKSPSVEALNHSDHEVFRSGSFDLVEPVGDLQQPPKEIRWKKVDEAVSYQVRLLEVDGSEMWKAETKEDHVDLPAPVRARIVPAKTLFCEVDAFNSSETKVSGTGLVRFRLAQNARNSH